MPPTRIYPHPKLTIPTIRRNLVPNPSFEVDLTNWTVSSGTGWTRTMTRVARSFNGSSGSYAMRLEGTHEATTTQRNFYAASAFIPVTASLPYALRGALDIVEPSATSSWFFYIDWYNGAAFLSSTVAATPNTVGASIQESLGSAPATATQCKIILEVFSAGSGDVVDAYLDAVLLEQAASPGDYFDGTHAGSAWEGAPNASTSKKGISIYVPGKDPEPDLQASVFSKGAFDAPQEHEAQLWSQAGSVLDFANVRQPAFAHGAVGGQSGAPDMKPGWKYAAEVLADNPVMYYRFAEAPSGAIPGAAQYQMRYVSANLGSAGGTLATAYLKTGDWARADGPTADVEYSLQAGASGAARGLGPASDTFIDSISLSPFVAAPAATMNFWAPNKPVTCECWFYRAAGARANGEMLWASSHTADGRPYSFFQRTAAGGTGTFTFQPDGNLAGTGHSWAGIPYATWADDAWTHVAFTWSGAGRVGRLFINGAPYSTSQTAGVDIPASPAYGTAFGFWFIGSDVWSMFTGSRIDEIACYEGVLSDARIAAHYAAR